MANILEDAIRTLDQMGVADVLLPFFLVFTLVFATLQKTQILGKDSKKFNVIIAFVAGMAVVFPHIMSPGSTYDVIPTINNALPIILMALVGVLMLSILIGLFTGQSIESWGGGIKGLFSLVAIIFVVYVFLVAGDNIYAPYWLRNLIYNSAYINTIIAVIVFVVVIGFVTSDKKDEKKDAKPLEWFEKLFK